MNLEIPYVVLFLAVLSARFSRVFGLAMLVAAMFMGLSDHALEPLAVVEIILAGVFAFWNRTPVGFALILIMSGAPELSSSRI